MGPKSSKSIVQDVINQIIKNSNSVSSLSTSNCASNNIINLTNCTVTAGKITQNNKCVLQAETIQKAQIEASSDSKQKQNIDQAVQSLGQTFDLSGKNSAAAVSATVTNLVTAISNAIKNSCTYSSTADNIFTCNGTTTIDYEVIQNNQVQMFTNCIQSSNIVSEASSAMEKVLDATARLKSNNTFVYILIAIGVLMVIAIIGYVVFKKTTGPKKNVGPTFE